MLGWHRGRRALSLPGGLERGHRSLVCQMECAVQATIAGGSSGCSGRPSPRLREGAHYPRTGSVPLPTLGAQREDLQRFRDPELGAGAPPAVLRRPGQQREAWTEEELCGEGESGPEVSFPESA